MASPKLNLALHIGTNYIPSEEDIAHIKNSVLPGPTGKLAELDIEIARVQDLYSSLTRQREHLLAEIEGYQSLISPARRLPIDILQEIFAHTLPTAHNALLDISECPILLTRICRGWRSVAQSTPHLWSTIHIPIPLVAGNLSYRDNWGSMTYSYFPDDFKTSALSSLKKYATTITNWLARSAVAPLSISLYDSGNSSVPDEHYEIVVDSFLPFANRWKDLILDAHSPALNRIAELKESDVPLLQSVTLQDVDVTEGWGPSRLLWDKSGIVKSARLQKVDYSQTIGNITHFLFKWDQLTDIKLSQIPSSGWGTSSKPITTLSDLVIVMSLSPRLISFHSEIGLLTSTGLVPPPSISSLPLLYLQKLVFHDGGANCEALFDLLEVPSLLHLEFFPTNDSSLSVLPTLLPRISGTILFLTTSSSFFSNPEVLSQCQKLISITIKSAPYLGATTWGSLSSLIQDFFLEDLTLAVNHPDRLTSALEVFECQEGAAFSDEAVLGFIKVKHSRADLAPLKRISIVFTRPREFDVLLDEEVAQCISNGLIVNLTYPMGLNPRVPFNYMPDDGLRRMDSRPVWPTSATWR